MPVTIEPASPPAPVFVNAPVVNADTGTLPLGPPVVAPQSDVDPVDPARERVYPADATHIVLKNSVSHLRRGDGLSLADLPTGQAGIDRLVSLGAIREMSPAELAARPAAPAPAPVAPAKSSK